MVILVMGVSGSGKSTISKMLADELQYDFQDADDFHPQSNIEKMAQGLPLTDRDREYWLQSMRQVISQWLQEDKNVVLACSALKKSYRQQLCYDHEGVCLVYLRGSYELIKQRLENRTNHFMGKDLLDSQFEDLEEPISGIQVDIDKLPAEVTAEIINRLGLME